MKFLLGIMVLVGLAAQRAHGQIPYFGFCPEYLPMAGFDMERFLGIWYEAERNFQLSEIASRCVMSNYTRGTDNKYHVINEVRSRVTGIKRVLEGEIRKAPSKAEEGKLHVKYTSVPVISPETQYNVLETDYDNYAVLWSCSGVGPLNAQNAWIMTRQRLAPGEILQKAYGVLDKYRISKTFFLKTNQEDCAYDSPIEPVKQPEQEANDEPSDEVSRTAAGIVPQMVADEPVIHTVEHAEKKPVVAAGIKHFEAEPAISAVAAEPIKSEAVVAAAEESPKSVPEVIMKIAAAASSSSAEQPKQEEQVKNTVAAVAEPVVKQHVKEQAVPLKEPAVAVVPQAVIAPEPVVAPVAAPAVRSHEEEQPKKIKKTEQEKKKKVEIVEEKVEIVKP